MTEEDNQMVIDIDEEELPRKATEHKVLVVDCWAEWCAPCKTISKYIEKLQGEYGGEVVFVKLDIEKNRRAVKKYGITTVPTLLLFYDGKFSDIILGAMDMEYIKNLIEYLMEREEG